jgi:hypothetical protein
MYIGDNIGFMQIRWCGHMFNGFQVIKTNQQLAFFLGHICFTMANIDKV